MVRSRAVMSSEDSLDRSGFKFSVDAFNSLYYSWQPKLRSPVSLPRLLGKAELFEKLGTIASL